MNSQPSLEEPVAAEDPIEETPQSSAGNKPGPVLTPGSSWVVTIFFSLVAAAAAAVPVWLSFVPKYRAVALLRVASKQQSILFKNADQQTEPDFEISKASQEQYIKSRYVLVAALRSSEIAGLPAVLNEADSVGWLEDHLVVKFPGDAEIMEVSLAMEDPADAAALVNAVVDAYMTEVVDVQRNEQRMRLNDLDKIYAEKETELRDKRTDLKVLAEQLGTGDTEALNLKQQLILQRFAALQTEHTAVEFRLMRAAGELDVKTKIKQKALDQAQEEPVSEAELEAYAQSDPLIRGLSFQAELLNYQLIQAGERGGAEAIVKEGERYNQHLREIDRKIKQRREELRKELQAKKRPVRADENDEELAELELEVAVLGQQEQRLRQDLDRIRKQAENFGGSSIDIEMLRAEIKLLAELLDQIARERQKLIIGLRSPSRITVIQRAAVPTTPEPDWKIPLTAGAGTGGFLLSMCLLA